MARKPADQAAAAPKPQGKPAIWAAMRKREAFTVYQIERDTDLSRGTITRYAEGLLHAGYLTPDPNPRRQRRLLRLVPEMAKRVGAEAPRVRHDGSRDTHGLGNEQIWRTMKLLGDSFSAEELALSASTLDVPVKTRAADNYCRHLKNAGYLRSTKTAGRVRYVFLPHRDTGPLPPIIQQAGRVFDANLARVVWPPSVEASEQPA